MLELTLHSFEIFKKIHFRSGHCSLPLQSGHFSHFDFFKFPFLRIFGFDPTKDVWLLDYRSHTRRNTNHTLMCAAGKLAFEITTLKLSFGSGVHFSQFSNNPGCYLQFDFNLQDPIIILLVVQAPKTENSKYIEITEIRFKNGFY